MRKAAQQDENQGIQCGTEQEQEQVPQKTRIAGIVTQHGAPRQSEKDSKHRGKRFRLQPEKPRIARWNQKHRCDGDDQIDRGENAAQ